MSSAWRDSPRSSPAVSKKPVKLKAACEQCNAAKVRCSGDKAGCERCERLELDCEYTESRVGRVPGIRARGKKALHRSSMGSGGSSSPKVHQNMTGSTTMSQEPVMQNGFENGMQHQMPNLQSATHSSRSYPYSPMEMFDAFPQEDHSTSASHDSFDIISGNGLFSMGSDMLVGSQDLNGSAISTQPSEVSQDQAIRNEGWTSANPSHPPKQTQPISSLQPTTSLPPEPFKDTDSRVVLACSQIISKLENYIQSKLKALDLALHVTRETMEQLNKLIDLAQTTRALRCMILFAAIMYQVVELLELACASMISSRNETQPDPLFLLNNAIGPSLPSFGFGANAEEQREWQTRIVMKELHRCSETLQRMFALLNLGPETNAQGSAEERANCYIDLRNRLRRLRQQVSAS